MCRWAPPCHRPLWKQHSALSVGRGVGCPCRLPSQDYPKTVCRKVHPKFAHLLTKQKINRQTLLQIVGVEFFEEKLEQFIYLSFFFFVGCGRGEYLSDTLNENLLGLLSCGVEHLKLFSKITKHSCTDTVHVTADELKQYTRNSFG